MLNKKFEVFSKLKKIKALVENQVQKKIKCLLTNNGGKLFSSKFDIFFANYGM